MLKRVERITCGFGAVGSLNVLLFKILLGGDKFNIIGILAGIL
tara:strand:+ start:282 stop:410 length:129 start_codon:yes stop_codon:yes gene_type:complete